MIFQGEGSLGLPRDYLDAITLRAYGILFTAAATDLIRRGNTFQIIFEIAHRSFLRSIELEDEIIEQDPTFFIVLFKDVRKEK